MPDQMFDGGASPMMGGMDAEGADPMMGDEPNMGGMDDPMAAGQDQYGADFDAGVEADEQSDPKKFIQQLTGKLSQSLRKYNEGLPQPDADLNKYVAGMIVKQCIEGLPQEDVQEILDKVNNDDQEQMDNGQGMEQQPMDQDMQQPMANQPDPTMSQQGGMPMNENSAQRQAISSRYDQFTNDEQGANEKVPNRNSYRKKVLVGKTFKS
jgi:hypothetical protein